VEPFRNSTTTSRIENYFTNDIKKEFYSKKEVSIVSRNEASVIMRGTVESVSQTGTAFRENINENIEASEYLLTIRVSISLINRRGKTIWSGVFEDQEIFNVFENIMKSESERLKAASRISKNMMKKVYDRIFTRFASES